MDLSFLDGVSTESDAWRAIEAAFGTLGRAVLLLDEDFRVLAATHSLGEMLCEHAARAVEGHPVSDLLGEDFVAVGSELRAALEQGVTQEGRRAFMRCGEGRARLASVSAARLPHEPPRYLVVIRPAESEVAMLHAGAGKGLVAESPAMQGIVRLIEQLGRSTANLLITGESGVGKEAVARAFHENSPRRGGPFVAINCAAIPDTLLESEFFGHRHGAFTGAIEDRVGRFEAAADGTLFLDEIGDLPHHLQAKLLRVLQERTFSRLGENRQRRLDARIIAATNADLQQAVAEGSFREDLYYRLSVVPIRIPPLRERPEDIEPLTRHLLLRISGREGRALLLSPDTLRLLQRYPWPGNVRQLQNVIEFAVAMCRGQTLRPDHLPQEVRDAAWLAGPADDPAQTHPPAWASGQGGGHPPPATEADRILRALEANHWRRQATARALGMSRSTLWRKMREYGIQG